MQHLSDRIKITSSILKQRRCNYGKIFSIIIPRETKNLYRIDRRKITKKYSLSIGRDKSTISREVSRNKDHIGYLYPGIVMQNMAQQLPMRPFINGYTRTLIITMETNGLTCASF